MVGIIVFLGMCLDSGEWYPALEWRQTRLWNAAMWPKMASRAASRLAGRIAVVIHSLGPEVWKKLSATAFLQASTTAPVPGEVARASSSFSARVADAPLADLLSTTTPPMRATMVTGPTTTDGDACHLRHDTVRPRPFASLSCRASVASLVGPRGRHPTEYLAQNVIVRQLRRLSECAIPMEETQHGS